MGSAYMACSRAWFSRLDRLPFFPTGGFLLLALPITQVEVYTLTAQRVLRRTVAPQTIAVALPTDQLEAGVYLLRYADHRTVRQMALVRE